MHERMIIAIYCRVIFIHCRSEGASWDGGMMYLGDGSYVVPSPSHTAPIRVIRQIRTLFWDNRIHSTHHLNSSIQSFLRFLACAPPSSYLFLLLLLLIIRHHHHSGSSSYSSSSKNSLNWKVPIHQYCSLVSIAPRNLFTATIPSLTNNKFLGPSTNLSGDSRG